MWSTRVLFVTSLTSMACGDTSASVAPRSDSSGSATPRDAPEVAGGESSEFSGGDVLLGYCPVVVSRMALALEDETVASWLALGVGHHESTLEWRDGAGRVATFGAEHRTVLSVDVTPLAAEDVVCSNGDAGGGYETEGLEGRVLRRFELGVELSTADGALSASFAALFYPLSDLNLAGERLLSGGGELPLAAVTGTLVERDYAEPVQALRNLDVSLTFGEGSAQGLLTLWALVSSSSGESEPSPIVTGASHAPDEGL